MTILYNQSSVHLKFFNIYVFDLMLYSSFSSIFIGTHSDHIKVLSSAPPWFTDTGVLHLTSSQDFVGVYRLSLADISLTFLALPCPVST